MNDTAGTILPSNAPRYSKSLLSLFAGCLSFLVAGMVLHALGFTVWAGLLGAMTVIFLVTIVLGVGLMWVLGKVSH